MADYKELLRRAVEALPENNGAVRRAVYEKARAALVGQLRAIDPPLAARDITSHRLQLEDCIRQVEKEASEAVLASRAVQPSPVADEPVDAVAPEPARQITASPDSMPASPAGGTIEDIIAAAHVDADAPEEEPAAVPQSTAVVTAMPLMTPAPAAEAEEESEGEAAAAAAESEAATDDKAQAEPETPAPPARPLPSIVARAEAAKGRSLSTAFTLPSDRSQTVMQRAPVMEPRRDLPRFEAAAHGGQRAALARREEPEVATAMSAIREVEVEAEPADPQSDIDRAIATLDREARGDTQAADNQAAANDATVALDDEDEPAFDPSRTSTPEALFKRSDVHAEPITTGRRSKPVKPAKPTRAERAATRRRDRREMPLSETGFPRARPEDDRGGMSALTIFLIVLAVLLIGAGGAGYWAVSQGYLDLGSMFRTSTTATATAATPEAEATPADASTPATGPGNTATPIAPPPATELEADERLVPEPALTGAEPLALVPPTDTGKSEERLGVTGADNASVEAAVAALDPASAAGSQSLLLEDSDAADTGAVPFSGTVDWSTGTDETGLPTLIAKANIPARNLGVDILIRKNQDPALPATHLMEINFSLSDGFIGGSIAGLPGVLLKNEELVQGTPLVGPSGVRVVANSFLFALSASPEDAVTNTDLLTTRKWMDLFVIYATGKRAILTLEKDEAAETMFAEVFEAWGATASATPIATESAE